MSHSRYHIIQFVCIIAVLAVIALQGFTGVVKTKPLEGVVATEKPVKLTFETYLAGSYQDYLSEHAKRHTGFREFFIRNYNQVCYSCFGKFNNNNIVVGENNELFTNMYVDDVTGKRVEQYFTTVDSAKMAARENVALTLRLMDTLKQHGTDFLFVFAPSKAAIYPEYLPEPYRSQLSDFSLIDYYITLFKENNIPHIDFYNYFKQLKDRFPYPLYSQYGTHWSYATIPFVTDSILRKMEAISGKKLPHVEITDLNVSTEYSGQDRELEGQFNLLFPLRKPAIPNPVFALTDTVGAARPNLVAVADSYFVPFEKTCFLEAFNSWNYLKYNEYVISSNPKYNWKKIEFLPETHQILEEADIVMALFTAPMMYEYMFGFPEMAMKLLARGPLCDEEQIEMMIQAICDNPQWYDAVAKQAKERGRTIEESLRLNAIYTIQNLEKANP